MIRTKAIFGIFTTLLAYYLGLKVNKKFKLAIFNPMIIGIGLSILLIKLTGASYEDYMIGGSYISFLVGLATVSLAGPFYTNLDTFLKYKKAIIIGSVAGALSSMVCIIALGKLFGLDRAVLVSLLPKSITTAIGSPLSSLYGGDYSITAVSIALTGIFGSIIFDKAFKILRIESQVAKGAALGTSAHAMGTSSALSLSQEAGAISGVCIVIAGIFSVLAMPFFVGLI